MSIPPHRDHERPIERVRQQYNPQPPPPPPTAAPLTPKPKRPWGWALGGLAAGLAVGAGAMGIIWGAVSAASSSPGAHAQQMENAFESCGLEADLLYVIPSETFDSVTFDSVGLASASTTFSDVNCFGEQIGMPSHVASEMGQTRALDGRQSASWDGYSVSWSYHPDNGMNAVFAVDR